MERFLADVVEALSGAGLDTRAARLAISEIETALMPPSTFAACLEAQCTRVRSIVECAVGGPVERLLITPVPAYILDALPALVEAFPEVVLADNVKVGTEIAGRTCVTLDEALADSEPFDAYLLGTVDQKLGSLFRQRLPRERTVAAADLVWFDPIFQTRTVRPALAAFHQRIQQSRKPLIVLAAYLDTTMGPTLEALNDNGFDVFIVTRREFAASDSHASVDPTMIGTDRHCAVEFDEMLWLLRHTDGCPVVLNYARFLASNWDMRNTIPLFAYGLAVMRAISGPRILHLYDAYQICLRGLEDEASSFALYRRMLDLADGIIVNADVAPLLEQALGPEKPVISFLRFGPDAEAQPEPDPGPFSVAMITGFLGEWDDPTRMTADAVRSLLRQGIHVHYYSSVPMVKSFMTTLSPEDASQFHFHKPIQDQCALIHDISRYHAGWFVADMRCCEGLGEHFSTPFARSLADAFSPTTVATAGIFYGCAGLPTIFNNGHYTAKLFAPGTTIEIAPDEVAGLAARIAEIDWTTMRRIAFEARERFMTGTHVHRLVTWLARFYPT